MPDQPTNHDQISEETRRRAEEYAGRVRQNYGQDASFDTVDSELAADWAAQTASDKTEWSLVRGIIKESWNRRDKSTASADAVANAGGFDHPPTFAESGSDTPRNRDEPNQ